MVKHVVFDRDGTLIKHIPYLHDVGKVELLPGVKNLIKELLNRNIKIHLHTNQSGVGRGFFAIDKVINCNDRLIELIGFGENIFESVCIASDYPPNKITYRKPSSLFGQELLDKYSLKKNELCYIGDNLSDLQTAHNIGCFALGINTGLNDLHNLVLNTNLDYKIYENMFDLFTNEFRKKEIC